MSWLYEPDNGHDLDEDDVRVRPNPKGSRPRTKRRPSFENAPIGMVLEVHLARYRVLMDSGVEVLATLAKELRKEGAVVGDRVAIDGEISSQKDALVRIVRVEPRVSLLTRSAEDGEGNEQAIVANADQLVIVVAAADPEPRARLVDRYLVAAFHAGLSPVLCVTKCDLADPSDFLEKFTGFDLKIVKTRRDAPALAELASLMKDHKTVFVGHSGVGKTTLVNQLAPELARTTGEVNEVTGKGKHTSSSARAIWAHGGWLIDTPGIRTFGLSAISVQGLLEGFRDLHDAAQACPRDCSHLADAPDCELDEASQRGEVSHLRLDSFRRLISSLSSVE
ncbi:MAG: ribosome small subunit-dependent GTPase [Actinomycetota bacterium]|jgi:ribosome biogenesis GTPase